MRLAAAESAQRDAVAAVTLARIEFEERKRARPSRPSDERRRAARRAGARGGASRRRSTPGSSACRRCARRAARSAQALGALASRLEALDERARAEADEAEGKARDRGAARHLADEEAGLRRAVDDRGERRTAVQVESPARLRTGAPSWRRASTR